MTESHGKVSATARGAKRQDRSSVAKFSGGIELLSVGEAVFITKPTSELANLIEWDLRDAQWHLRRELGAYELAMYAADLVHHVVQDHDAHPVTFAALRTFLARAGDPRKRQSELLRFQWDVIVDAGFMPVLEHDAQTGMELDDSAGTWAFSARAGGVVADSGGSDRWRVRRSTIELLRDLAGGVDVGEVEEEAVVRANRLLCAYARAILDRELPTMDAVMKGTGM
jgi:DNA repair protein RecO